MVQAGPVNDPRVDADDQDRMGPSTSRTGPTDYAIDPEKVVLSVGSTQVRPGAQGSGALLAVSPNGKKVYFSSGGADFYALSAGASGGRLLWTFPLPPAEGNPTFGSTPSSVLMALFMQSALMAVLAPSMR